VWAVAEEVVVVPHPQGYDRDEDCMSSAKNAKLMSTDDVEKFVDELYNYAKRIPLERMNSYNK
jgi:hypothetical protein